MEKVLDAFCNACGKKVSHEDLGLAPVKVESQPGARGSHSHDLFACLDCQTTPTETQEYGTCDARMQDEFPGFKGDDGKLVEGSITQVEEIHPGDAGVVVAWFDDGKLAEKVVALLNTKGRTL